VVDAILKFVITIILALVTGITNFVTEAAYNVFVLGYSVLIVLVLGFLLWQGIAFIRRRRTPR
jgi:spore maturation protein SpmA